MTEASGDAPSRCQQQEGQGQWFVVGSTDHADMVTLASILLRLATSKQDGFTVRFEVSPATESHD